MGVTDFAFMHCRVCKRHTVHITDWDAETPDKLWVECLEHENHSYDVPITGLAPQDFEFKGIDHTATGEPFLRL